MKTKLQIRLLAVLSLLLAALPAQPAHAATALTVNTLADNETVDGFCTLREAIKAANNNADYRGCAATGYGDDTITLNLSGTIVLGSGLPAVTATASGGALTIDGAGQSITVSGNDTVNAFSVLADAALTLQNLTVANADTTMSGGGVWSMGTLTVTNCTFSNNHTTSTGGGIYNGGTLTVTNSTFSDNSATTSGGGIYNGGTLTVTNSTFSDNSASDGGGINNGGTLTVTNSTFSGNNATTDNGGGIFNGGTLTVTNSTFSDNSATTSGGGIYNGGGALLTITNSTFSGNSATASNGGGIYTVAPAATLRNSIVASSTTGGNCSGTITNDGNNIDDGTTCGWGSANGSMSSTNPLLDALQDNGGPSWTHALLAGSPAIDAGTNSGCPATDQRGITRPQDGDGDNTAVCDIGSYEAPDTFPPSITSITRADPNPTNLTSIHFTVTFSESVTGVDKTDFSLTTTGVSGASVSGVSGSGATRTVAVDTGTGNGTLRLNVADNDSILDVASNPLGGAGAGNGDFTSGESYTVDKTAPTVVSSVRADPNPTTAASVHFTVTFSETVSGVDTADFSLTVSGISGASVTAVSGSGATRTVSVDTGTGNGTLRLNVADNDSILDAASNPLGGAGAGNGDFTSGESYTVDKTPPTVVSSLRADPNPTTAASVHFTVTFSEPVSGVDQTDFSLTVSGLTGASVTAVSGSGATRTLSVDTGSGHGTLRLNVVDNDTILDGAGNPLGGAGAGNGNYTSGQKYTIDRDNQFRSAASRDGWVLESSETSGKGGSLAATGTLRLGDNAANKQYRSLLYFNTASLPDNATLTKVTLKIRKASVAGTNPFTTHGPLLADIKKGAFGASPLQIGDFQATASKANVGHFTKVGGSTVWYQLVLGAANYQYINKAGVTQFRLRFTKDDNNDRGADFASFYAGNATTASNRPLLIVEYTLP